MKLSGTELLQSSSTLFLPFCLGHPHVLLVGNQVGQNSTTQEDHVSPSRRVFDADLEFLLFSSVPAFFEHEASTYVQSLWVPLQHPRKPQLLHFFLQPRRQTGVHAATTTEHNCPVQTRTHVHISTLDSVEEHLGNSGLVDVDQVRLEETFRGFKALASYPNNSTVGKGVRLDQDGGIFGELLVQLQVVRNVAKLLLDLAHRLEICRTVQGVSTAEE